MIVNAFGKGGGSYLEPGDHLVHVFEIKNNDKVGKPAIDIIFKDNVGQKIKDTFWLTDEAMWRIANLAIACGYASGPKDETLKRFDPFKLQGRMVMIRVIKETNSRDNKEYSVVKTFWSPKAPPASKPIEDDLGRDDKGFEAYDRQKQDDPF